MEAWYLECLVRWTAAKGIAPSVAQLAGWVGKSRTAVHSALNSLEHKGHVTRCGPTKSNSDRKFMAVRR